MKIQLTESELREMVSEIIKEECDEAFLNQMKTGVKSAFGKGPGDDTNRQNGGINLGKRWNAAKTGFKQQGAVDDIDQCLKYLNKLVQAGKVNPDQTVGQLLHMPGGSNRFQKGSLGTMRAHANAKISKAQNDIYR